MGYETKLVLGYPYRSIDEELGAILLCKVAEVNLSKVSTSSATGRLLAHLRAVATQRYAYYADDGNTVITEDRYGDRLSAVPLLELLKAIDRDQEVQGAYRRFTLARGLLDAAAVHENDWRYSGLVCIQYGY